MVSVRTGWKDKLDYDYGYFLALYWFSRGDWFFREGFRTSDEGDETMMGIRGFGRGFGRGLGRTIVILLTLAATGHVARAGGDVYRGPVTVVDGNTLAFGARRVRLFGSDAPDLGQSCWYHKRRFACGKVARDALMDLLTAQRVVCRAVGAKAGGGRDDAGRVRVRCLADGYDVAENMVHTGWAVATRGAAGPLVARYAVTERKARKARRGLWRGRFIRPAAWRARAHRPAPAAPG